MILAQPTLADLLLICSDLEADQVAECEALHGAPFSVDETALRLYQMDGVAYVLRDEQRRPYCAGGYRPVNERTAQSWMISTPARRQHTLAITRGSRQVMRQMHEAGFTRLQTFCTASRQMAQAWYRTLGLRCETRLANYGNHGEDVMIYVEK